MKSAGDTNQEQRICTKETIAPLVSKHAMNLSGSLNIKDSQVWLLGILAGLTAIYLTLVWRSDNSDLFGNSLLFIAAIASLIKEKAPFHSLKSNSIASIVGTTLLAFLLIRSLGISSNSFLLAFPAIAGVGLALVASGVSGLSKFRQEILILVFLGFPRLLLPIFIDPTALTAKFSALVLWYMGFEVARNGYQIQIGDSAVEVFPGCSGIESICYLLSLAGLFIMMFPLRRIEKVGVAVLAIAIAFIVNGFRVALLAHLVAASLPEAFEYWHEGNGSFIFSMISVAILGLFCWLLLRQKNAQPYLEELNVQEYD
ncbi:cyanoexosortase A [Leptolyngbya sp. AN02str]|uniref:cyanoexosortase A n=1 Tax=Leptolyngbya sp. AN02str TaxID=3423363 RepID=UPI003D314768